MSNKIVVPRGMLKEARHAFFDPSKALREASDTECLFSAIEAALRWWLENPMYPTHVEVESILSMVQFQGLRGTNLDRLQDFAVMCQRRMFLAPDPEAVRSFIKNEVEIGWRDGLVTAGPFIRQNACWTPDQAEKFAEHLKSSAQKAREQKPPEPEVPEEIKDLLMIPVIGQVNGEQVNDQIMKAYRRGQKAGEK